MNFFYWIFCKFFGSAFKNPVSCPVPINRMPRPAWERERVGVKQAKIAPRPGLYRISRGSEKKSALYYVIMSESQGAKVPQEGEREQIFGKHRSLGEQFGIVFGSIVGNGAQFLLLREIPRATSPKSPNYLKQQRLHLNANSKVIAANYLS